jgi:hypothetical protein
MNINVNLTDADGLEIPNVGQRSKESSYVDDSLTGQAGGIMAIWAIRPRPLQRV